MNENQLKELREDIKEINEKLFRGSEKLTKLDASYKSIHKRMDARDDEIKAITKIAHSVETLSKDVGKVVEKLEANDLDTMSKDLEKVTCKVEQQQSEIIDLKHRPAKRVSEYVEQGFIYAMLLVIGFVASRIMGG